MSIIEILREAEKRIDGLEVYIVGGYVRDLFIGKINKDIDIVVRNVSIRKIESFLRNYGYTKYISLSKTNDEFESYILEFKTEEDDQVVQISLPRRGDKMLYSKHNTLREDAAHRDFTINALYLPIGFKDYKKECIDLVGGLKDIDNKVIKSVGNDDNRIKESPVRMLRSMSLSARTGFMIDVNLLKSITKNKLLIKSIPVENIRDELNEIIMSDVPSRVLILMQKLQILDYILPELSRCVGIKQDKRYHAHNVFKHCVYACDEADKDLVLRLACLLHDVGKSFKGVRRVSELGKVSFHKHETMGAEAVENRLTQLKYSNDTVKKVTSLIKFHMYHYSSDTYQCTSKSCNWKIPTSQSEEITICPECKSKVVYTKGWTDGSVINFIRNVGISEDDLKDLNEFPLFKLRAAERKSNPIKRGPIAQKQIDFQNRIVEVYNKYKIMTVNDLDISGDIIMKIYNLSPSQKIGMIKRYLLERLENEVENGGDMHELNKQSVLLKWVFDFIVEEDNKDVV